ncbi:hypothetical protein J583_3506 [Acinetobacter baumannii 83444]|uniref:hypothetical protein n=1 Tax=Acinetobacter baumannii TaxID=470 RepID=UPI000450F930|nr:hypothetical protein [Acinetobacter baumannii]EXE71703.1 hypothetical protein J583_3506 [Acinetobacter baumannii 83444]KRI28571.1 hypothetical protein APD18_01875 [Acinetobacter baumannii]OTU58135.1 hypothetical protein CAT33_18415 [Acinetobacter baumannii]
MQKFKANKLRTLICKNQITLASPNVHQPLFLYSDFRLDQMLDIPRFVLECNKTQLPAATVKQTDQGREYFECEDWFRPFFIKTFDDLISTNPYFLKPFDLCEETKCFFRTLDAMISPPNLYGLFERNLKGRNPSNLKQRIELLNEFIELLRKELNSPTVKDVIRKREEQHKENFTSCKLLVSKLLQKYGQLWVIPVDFAYTPDQQDLQHNNPTDLKQEFHRSHRLELLKQQIAQLLENRRRNKTLKQIVGYLFSFGHSLKKGFFVKVIFFLDGNSHSQAKDYAEYLSQYWSRLTNQQGCTYFCDGDLSQSPTVGISLIKETDKKQRENLMLSIQYYCQLEQFFRLKYLGENSYKRLQMSQPPVISKVKASGFNQNLNVKRGK